MSSLIQAMSTDDVIICRRKGRYIKGRFKSTSEKRLKARMAVFPLTPNELLRLPEARRTTESLNFYSDERLFTTDEKISRRADLVHVRNKVFEIHSVEDWTNTDLPHFRSIGVKVDGQGSGQS